MMIHSFGDVMKISDSSLRQKRKQIENLNYLHKDVLQLQLLPRTPQRLKRKLCHNGQKTSKEKMIRLRRTVGHVTTIINSKNTDKFTNHPRNLEEKYHKNMTVQSYILSNLTLLY